MDNNIGVTTLSELQIWIEGKFALVAQAQGTMAEDVRQVRSRVHDLSNEVAALLALGLDEKVKRLEEADAAHAKQLTAMNNEAHERRGAIAAVKIAYIVVGAAIGYATSVFLTLYR